MTHSGATESRSDSGVRLLRNHGLAELVLDRAAKRNALSYEMWSAIPHLVAQVEADNAVSVLIVRGAGVASGRKVHSDRLTASMDSPIRRGHPRIPPALRHENDIDVPTRSEEPAMAGLIRKSLESPEETRPFEDGKGKLELVNLEGGPVGRATFEPGWQWSKHVKPIAGTDSCEAAHMGYFVSGRMKVVMDDGEEMDYGPGDFAVMAPGHDAWVVGDEPCVVIDWQGFADYAKR
jgi:quercetin dioxygenase-like cupin family protein